jgi:hypothetical protein
MYEVRTAQQLLLQHGEVKTAQPLLLQHDEVRTAQQLLLQHDEVRTAQQLLLQHGEFGTAQQLLLQHGEVRTAQQLLLQQVLAFLDNYQFQYKTSSGGTKGLHMSLCTKCTHSIVGVVEKTWNKFLEIQCLLYS